MTATLEFMQEAINEATNAVLSGDGLPFGAVVVQNGKIIARGHNSTTVAFDPTAHGEICALRAAGQRLNSSDLSGCGLYSSCYPCVMCQGDLVWARITKVYYAATAQERRKHMGYDQLCGFRDEKSEKLVMEHVQMNDRQQLVPFELFSKK